MSLLEALARYDAAVAKCPVNNFAVDRRAYGPKDKCSACGQIASGNCGKEASASYHLVREVRAIASSADAPGKADRSECPACWLDIPPEQCGSPNCAKRGPDRDEDIGPPTPLGALRFRMEQGGHTQTDLARLIGSRSRAAEILSGKRSMSKAQIAAVSDAWGIPARSLLGPSPRVAGEPTSQNTRKDGAASQVSPPLMGGGEEGNREGRAVTDRVSTDDAPHRERR